MEKYQTIVKEIKAQQYTTPKQGMDGVELIHYDGVGGYAGRLSYLKNKRGELVTVRPSDWVVVEYGKDPVVMANEDFTSTYELTKQSPRAKKQGNKADNVLLKAPAM